MVGDVSSVTDIGNLHNYKGGWNPGFSGSFGYDYPNYLSDALAISLAGITNPDQPVVSTETGYTNAIATQDNQVGYPPGTVAPYDANSVSEAIAGTYMPRVPLTAWQSGIQRTYVNELVSSPGLDYGLLRGDGTPKPAFLTLSNLLYLLSDPGPAFQVTPLSYSIFGGDSTLQHLLLQQRDGSYYLVLWLESSTSDNFRGVARRPHHANIPDQQRPRPPLDQQRIDRSLDASSRAISRERRPRHHCARLLGKQ
jgi:hypothetical protein